MYEDIIAGFCPSCLSKNVNSNQSVKDVIMMSLRAGERNNLVGGYLLLQGALVTLQEEGGCHFCIDLL